MNTRFDWRVLMKMYREAAAGAAKYAPLGLLRDEPSAEEDPDFRDFMEDFSLSHEELEAFVATPDLSVPKVKRLFAGRHTIRS